MSEMTNARTEAGALDCWHGSNGSEHTRKPRQRARIAKPPTLSETAEDYPHVLARLSEHWRLILCPQGLQWIPQRRDPGGSRWRNAGYFTTSFWLRVFCSRLVSDPAAWRALESLPEHVSGSRRTRPQRRKGSSGSRAPEKANVALASDGGGA